MDAPGEPLFGRPSATPPPPGEDTVNRLSRLFGDPSPAPRRAAVETGRLSRSPASPAQAQPQAETQIQVAAAPVERGHDGPDRAEIVQLEREVGRLRATVTSLEGQLASAEARADSAEAKLTAAEHRANTAEAQLLAPAAAPVAPRSEAEDALSLLHHARATASATVDAATLRSGEIVAGAEAQARQLLDEAASFARTLVDEAEARRHATDARVAEVEAELARYQQLLTSVSIDLRDAAAAISPTR